MIQELQKSVKLLQDTQNNLISHIKSLEDTVLVLSDSEDNTAEYKKAKKIAGYIKRKRLDQRSQEESDSDVNKEPLGRRRSPRFRKITKQQSARYYALDEKE